MLEKVGRDCWPLKRWGGLVGDRYRNITDHESSAEGIGGLLGGRVGGRVSWEGKQQCRLTETRNSPFILFYFVTQFSLLLRCLCQGLVDLDFPRIMGFRCFVVVESLKSDHVLLQVGGMVREGTTTDLCYFLSTPSRECAMGKGGRGRSWERAVKSHN